MGSDQSNKIVASSFRDPSGFVFFHNGDIYRQVNKPYKNTFDHFIKSGLYDHLVSSDLLVEHEEVDIEAPEPDFSYSIIKPALIPFISYPYEWCFSQLKDAALVTLKLQEEALDFGMVLKDASAFNIQFRGFRPVLIDTLSFDIYKEGSPWVAYQQFCQHFLAPLALMSYTDIRLNKLLRLHIDGIPLNLAKKLLPFRSLANISLLLHIHFHARSQAYYSDTSIKSGRTAAKKKTLARKVSLTQMRGLIESLRGAVHRLKWKPDGTEWGDYYEDTNYSIEAMDRKNKLVADFLEKSQAHSVWDLGANTGTFSRIASSRGMDTVSFDIDPAAVEKNYLSCKEQMTPNLLPLIMDLTNPSPSIGWQNNERLSFAERKRPDAILALALIHHLAISNNVPFDKIAIFFAALSKKYLIIEFVPKDDSQVQRLLLFREDIFTSYTKEEFENEFRKVFTIEDCKPIEKSERFLYLMKVK